MSDLLVTEKDEALKTEIKSEPAPGASKHDMIVEACQLGDIDRLVKLADSADGLLDDLLRVSACRSTFTWQENH